MTSFLHQYAQAELLEAFERSERLSFRQTLEDPHRVSPSRSWSKDRKAIENVLRRSSSGPRVSLLEEEEEVVTTTVEVVEEVEQQPPEADRLLNLSSLVVGSTMKLQEDIRSTTEWQSWGQAAAEGFSVRAGPNYAKTKRKLPSLEALYDLVACDYIRNIDANGDKLSHLAGRVTLPGLRSGIDDAETIRRSPLPRFIVCNCQLPYKPPKMMGRDEEDAGSSLVMYFAIRPEIASASLDLQTCAPAIRKLVEFVKQAESDSNVARLFKMLGFVDNMAKLGVPAMLRGYNGKPIIVHKTGQLYFGSKDEVTRYMEMDVSIHSFKYYAKRAFWSLKDLVPKMDLRIAFVIQAEKDEEMPETIFGAASFANIMYDDATPVQID